MKKEQTGMNKEKMIKISFWLLPFFLFIFQLIFTLNSTNQIRYEELAESIRNPYWLLNHTVYDGVSSNIGWYGTLLILYNLFGFSLNTAKFFRLILYLISIICLALTLKKYLGTKKSLLPLLTIGLSPTFLYFNTLQTSYGLDLQYFPICFLIATTEFNKKILEILQPFIFGLIIMVAWMSYPTFAFYLPALWGIYLWKIFKINNKQSATKKIAISFLSFLLPLALSFLYVKDKSLLIFDYRENSGLFRGAGTIKLDLNIFWQNINHLFLDLFQKGNSYYFELPQPDFSSYFPIITVIFAIILSILIFIKFKKYRLILLTAFSILILNLLFANFNLDPSRYPGIRRNTGILAAFYLIFVVIWHYFSNQKIKSSFIKNSILIIFLLLPFHHLISYPANLDSLKNPSNFRELWFGLTPNPNNYLNSSLNSLQKEDTPLSCRDKDGKTIFCRYGEIYGALAGTCYWNHLDCKQILGYDPKTNKFILLKIELWEKYYWPH